MKTTSHIHVIYENCQYGVTVAAFYVPPVIFTGSRNKLY